MPNSKMTVAIVTKILAVCPWISVYYNDIMDFFWSLDGALSYSWELIPEKVKGSKWIEVLLLHKTTKRRKAIETRISVHNMANQLKKLNIDSTQVFQDR